VLVLADCRSFHTERYVAELRRQGCCVLVASLEHGSLHHFKLKAHSPLQSLYYPLTVPAIRALVGRFMPDIINPHFASGYGFTAALARPRVPILLHLWGSDILLVPNKSALHRAKTKLALQSASGVIGDSEYLLQEAAKIAGFRQQRKIVWGIEKECLTWHREDYRLSRPLKVIVPRPHEPVYNNAFLLEALAPLINDRLIDVTWPGFGSMLSAFQRKATELAGNQVHYYECMPRREFLQFEASHDIYLSAALSDSSPASLIEAMGLGLIPVAGDIPGVREWLGPDNGCLFDLSEPDSLCEILTDIAGRDDNHALMRKTNLEKVKRVGIFENNIAETIGIMCELAGKS